MDNNHNHGVAAAAQLHCPGAQEIDFLPIIAITTSFQSAVLDVIARRTGCPGRCPGVCRVWPQEPRSPSGTPPAVFGSVNCSMNIEIWGGSMLGTPCLENRIGAGIFARLLVAVVSQVGRKGGKHIKVTNLEYCSKIIWFKSSVKGSSRRIVILPKFGLFNYCLIPQQLKH